MPIYDTWCEQQQEQYGSRTYVTLTEKAGGRAAIGAELGQTLRSHYDRRERIADDIARLGYPAASEILRALLPISPRARSGDLGEVLASELVEEKTTFRIPVRRMRYKDGREVAMRGDDFIGARHDQQGLSLAKGEAKSRQNLAAATIKEARDALTRHDGRCTPDSLLFVANRLLESADLDEQALGRTIRDEVGLRALPENRIDHILFTMSGNAPPAALKDDLIATADGRNQTTINLRIVDHQAFIEEAYQVAADLGNF